jgi:hypothetical protein
MRNDKCCGQLVSFKHSFDVAMTEGLKDRYIEGLKVFTFEFHRFATVLKLGYEEVASALIAQTGFLLNTLNLAINDTAIDVYIPVTLGNPQSDEIMLEAYRDILKNAGLESLAPRAIIRDPALRFRAIWDAMHMLSILCDTAIGQSTPETKSEDLKLVKNMKNIFYNIYLILGCSVCVNHYQEVKGSILVEFEKAELSIWSNRPAPSHLITRAVFNFHNHVTMYRSVQYGKPDIQRGMTWDEFTYALGLPSSSR